MHLQLVKNYRDRNSILSLQIHLTIWNASMKFLLPFLTMNYWQKMGLPLLNIRLKYLSIAIFILENTVNMEVSTFHFSDYKNARYKPGISTNFHH